MSLAFLIADAAAQAPKDDHGPWLFWLISGKNPFWQNAPDPTWLPDFIAPYLNYHKWVQKEPWENFLKFMRTALAMAGAGALMYKMRALKLGTPVPRKVVKYVAIAFTLLGFGVYFDYFNPNTRYSEYYHRHEFYHYYLGSKFFKEIGYTELYECTAVAEVELGRGAAVAKRDLRDLHVNLIKPIKDTYVLSNPEKCKNKFSAARWEDWKKDVDWFYHSSVGSYWDNMQKDHGYNPPPVWGMTGKLFASIAPAGDTFFNILSMIDVALHVGIVLLFYWAFGF